MQNKHIIAGIITGVAFGLVIFWGATYAAFLAGGSVTLAAGLDGFMAALGGGGLIGRSYCRRAGRSAPWELLHRAILRTAAAASQR
jgi:hypothetical protein